jgi:D-alanyl-lipoteichoic acid acyltransferase DltB (MBOAT superfamily)
MLFNSLNFVLGFLPLAVLSYRLLVRLAGPRWAVPWLAALSYAFYLAGGQAHPWLLAGSIAMNWLGGGCIRLATGPHRKTILWLFVGADILTLGYFKYFNFAVVQLQGFGLLTGIAHNVVLPVGISFYTFTQIAFLVDTYRNLADERSTSAYALFVSFFPHLIAGPILHHKEMMSQFRTPSTTGFWKDLYSGTAMFTIGLAKKVLLADSVGRLASGFFGSVSPGSPPGFCVAWIGVLAYTAQIYFDFSGYSDMAIGMSQMMGIRLPLNFNAPYKSASIIEFWRRWHITLSRFLRDYLYFALGGNRRGRARRHLNLFVTMVLGGLWHGAGWTFIAWGAIHGALLTVAHLWRDLTPHWRLPRVPVALGWFLTFAAVVFAWVPFRASDLASTFSIWSGMIALHGTGIPKILVLKTMASRLGLVAVTVNYGLTEFGLLSGALLLAWLAPTSQEITRRFRLGLDSPGYSALPTAEGGRFVLRASWGYALAIGLLFGVAVRLIGGYSEFIYFQF